MLKIKNRKGQGALEYLLIISGALIVAVTVVVILLSMSSSNRESVAEQDEALSRLIDDSLIPPIVNIVSCTDTRIYFALNSSESNFVFIANEGGITDLNVSHADIALSDGIYEIRHPTLPAAIDDRHSLSVAVKKNNKYSAFSKPVSTCRP
jgi:hypothetical protein